MTDIDAKAIKERESENDNTIYSGLYGSLIQYVGIDELRCPRRPNVCASTVKAFSESISKRGFLRPVYIDAERNITDGRKRFTAALSLGLKKIPCVFAPNPLVFEDDIIISELRSGCEDFFKSAEDLETLTKVYLYSQEDAARAIGRSQSYVANKLRLLSFSPEERKAALDGELSERHCRALLRVKDSNLRKSAAFAIISAGMSVSAAEDYVTELVGPDSKPKRLSVSAAVERMISSLPDGFEAALASDMTENGAEIYTLTIRPKRFT